MNTAFDWIVFRLSAKEEMTLIKLLTEINLQLYYIRLSVISLALLHCPHVFTHTFITTLGTITKEK